MLPGSPLPGGSKVWVPCVDCGICLPCQCPRDKGTGSCTPPHSGAVHQCPQNGFSPCPEIPPQTPLPKASLSPSRENRGLSLTALRANNSHQLPALFPRATAIARSQDADISRRHGEEPALLPFMKGWLQNNTGICHSIYTASVQIGLTA